MIGTSSRFGRVPIVIRQAVLPHVRNLYRRVDMNYMRAREERRKQLKITGIKLLHFLITVAVFYFFWILFRYG